MFQACVEACLCDHTSHMPKPAQYSKGIYCFLKVFKLLRMCTKFEVHKQEFSIQKKYDGDNFTPTTCKQLPGQNTQVEIRLIELTEPSLCQQRTEDQVFISFDLQADQFHESFITHIVSFNSQELLFTVLVYMQYQ